MDQWTDEWTDEWSDGPNKWTTLHAGDAVKSFTGKDEYTFGDITSTLVSRGAGSIANAMAARRAAAGRGPLSSTHAHAHASTHAHAHAHTRAHTHAHARTRVSLNFVRAASTEVHIRVFFLFFLTGGVNAMKTDRESFTCAYIVV